MAQSKLKLTQVKSLIGRTSRQKCSLRGLGLRRLRHTVEVDDTPANRGMINRIRDMILVEEA